MLPSKCRLQINLRSVYCKKTPESQFQLEAVFSKMFRSDARGAKTEPQQKLGEYRNVLPFNQNVPFLHPQHPVFMLIPVINKFVTA